MRGKLRFSTILVFSLILALLGNFPSSVTAQEKATPAVPPPSETFTPLPEESPTESEILPSETFTPLPEPSATSIPASPTPENIKQIAGDYVEDEILIRLSPSTRSVQTTTKDCFANEQVKITSELGAIGAVLLKLDGISVSAAIAHVANCPNILFAEPNYHLYATDTFPNDPNFSNQYGLTAIHAPQGWDTTTGSAAVIIAIIDTGVDLTHPDLAGKIVAGYDFVNGDAVPDDDNGHGTHVAGIAAASSNNGAGVAGVSWGARIMPIKVLNSGAGGSFANAASGIIWATDHGAQIINLSLGGSSNSSIFQNAIDYAYAHGVTLVAASGNSGNGTILYPARYPNVIAVGATDLNNNLAVFSNYGAELDVVAPGVNIYSTWLGNHYQNDSGTSMSTPYVSGLAAILRGISGSGSPANLAWTMKSTALDLGAPGRDDYYGDGLIQMDAAIALLWVTPTFTPTQTSSPQPPRPTSGYTPPAVLPTATFSATPSPTAIPTETAFTPPTAIPSYQADDGAADLIALATPTKIEFDNSSNQKKPLLPCIGSLCVLFGIFLFWLGLQMKKNAR